MRRCVVWTLVSILIISLAAPSGAVFATETLPLELNTLAEDETLLPELENHEEVDSDGEAEGSDDVTTPVSDEGVSVEPPTTALALDDDNSPELEEVVEIVSPGVIIAQIQVGAPGSPGDEYVSIYNNSNEPVDVTGWCLHNKSRPFACLNEIDTDYIIDPGGYIGFSSLPNRLGDHGLVVGFMAGSNQIVASSDTIQLVSGEFVVDTVSWESTPPTGHYAIERLWDVQVPGYLRADAVGWSWKVNLPIYGHILELVECEDGVLVIMGEQCPEPVVVNMCTGLVLSEIAANINEQFIELQNISGEPVLLGGCQLKTNRQAKSFVFDEEIWLGPGEYAVVLVAEAELTLTKTTTGSVELLSSDGLTKVDSIEYRNLAKETSWSLVDGEWFQTYALTPGSLNIYQRYLPCDLGYWRNEETGRCNRNAEVAAILDCGEGRERNLATGRCRNIPGPRELAPCREGQYRSEETNRCRSIATAAAGVLKPCADDQFRNPLTNRCKKIASAEDVALADCGEGRERNPATNRCRNVLAATMPSAPFAPEQIAHTAQSTLGWWALGGVSIVAIGYAGWQWRFEVARLVRRINQVFVTGPKE